MTSPRTPRNAPARTAETAASAPRPPYRESRPPGIRWRRCRFRRRAPRRPADARGQSALEFCFAMIVLLALACPCIEAARMASDSMLAKAAAADAARAAAAAGPAAFDAQAFLARAYPGLEGASATVAWRTPSAEPYRHRLVQEDGTVLTRDSVASCQRVDVRVEAGRPFATPLGTLLASFSGTTGYAVAGTGSALRDTTAASGRW